MEGQALNLAAAAFFLTVLVLIARSRKTIASASRDCYRHISAGAVILALVAVGRLAMQSHFISAIPLISDPLFFRLLSWIGTITGLVLLASGVSIWMPLGRIRNRVNQSQLRRLGLLRKLEQLVGVENRPRAILEESLRHMVQQFGSGHGAVYHRLPGGDELPLLASAGTAAADALMPPALAIPEHLVSAARPESNLLPDQLRPHLPSQLRSGKTMILPIWDGPDLSAIYLLSLTLDDTSDDDRVILKLAADIIGRAVSRHTQPAGRDVIPEATAKHLHQVCASHKSFSEKLGEIVRCLRMKVDLDYASVVVSFKDSGTQRYTLGTDAALLHEKGLDATALLDLSRKLSNDGSLMIVSNRPDEQELYSGLVVNGTELPSVMVLPLMSGRELVGVFVAGSKEQRPANDEDQRSLRAFQPALQRLVQSEVYSQYENLLRRRQALVNRFMADLRDLRATGEVFAGAARLLMKEVRTSAVRISTVEDEGAFLRSRALELSHPPDGLVPAEGYMILSLMPYHRRVLETGRLMVISQENADSAMTLAEAQQIYRTELTSTLIVPISTGNQTLAVISLADRRKRGRFQYAPSDILLVSSVASVLSLVMPTDLRLVTTYDRDRGVVNTDQTPLPDVRQLRRAVKSSLAGILGSVEMIRQHRPETSEELNRYLSLIDTSAQRLNENVL